MPTSNRTPVPSDLDRALAPAIQARHAAHLARSRLLLDSAQGPEPLLGGRRVLSFASNDYLGLASHPDVVAAFRHGATELGVGSGASHLLTGHSRAHRCLEEALAEFTGRPRALLFSTGYMANLAVVGALLGRHDAAFEDRYNHASLLDGAILSRARLHRFPHADPDALARQLAGSAARRKLVLTDGVFSMDGDLAPLPALCVRARQAGAWVAVDDAHGLGVVGPGGGGSLEAHGLGVRDVPVLVGTLGKAFGTFGAFVAGTDTLVETLIQFARPYVYTTATPPAVAAATLASLALVRDGEARERLWRNIDRFRRGAAQLALPVGSSGSALHAVMLGEVGRALEVSRRLEGLGILVPAIRPPTVPPGTARLRISLSAAHTPAHVDRLLEGLSQTLGSGKGPPTHP